MSTIIDRPARSAWQRDLIDRLDRSKAVFIPTLIGIPFEEGFEIRFSRWQGHWRIDAWPGQPEFTPDRVNIESLRAIMDRVLASGWTRGKGDAGVDSVWVSGFLGSREVTLHVRLGASA